MKALGQYQHIYVQNDTLLLGDVFENFRNIFVETYELDPANLLSVPDLEWQEAFKKM